MGRLIAAADIGSNTAHLLIASVGESGLKRLVNTSEWLSLGQHVSREGRIGDSKRKELIATLREFRQTVDEYGVDDYYVFATEAMRVAENHDEVLAQIEKKTDTKVEIISPAREAELSVLAAAVDCPGPDPMLMVEAGGGSVQVAFCEEGKVIRQTSLPIGTGVLTNRSGLEYPATTSQIMRLREIIAEECEIVADYPSVARIVGCGGVARGLWRAMHADGERDLVAEEISFLAWDTQRLSPKTIVARYGVKLRRAETLLPGAYVFLEIMGLFGHDHVTVSQYGVREGAVLEMARSKEEWLRNE